MTIDPQDFKFICTLVEKESGIHLTADKEYLVESRLLPVTRKFQLIDIGALVSKLQRAGDAELTRAVIDAMTTNETFFFRDTKPFDYIKDSILPDMLPQLGPKFRVWSAACSTGQEPYSLSILLKENPSLLAGKSYSITATDICWEVLDKAQNAVYSQFEVQRGLSIALLMKYFAQSATNKDAWKLKDEIRTTVDYKHLNLLEHYTMVGPVDLIMCRNVLIYFETPVKQAILQKMHSMLPPHGVLMLGGSETLIGVTDSFTQYGDMRGVYKKA